MKKICEIIVCTLLITTVLSFTAIAGDPKNPEVVDRLRDVKLFGLINIPLQMEYDYVDIVAAWFQEDNTNPEYLSVSLQIRNLEERTEELEAIYDVDWLWNNDRFIACLHINPDGIGSFFVGRSLDDDDTIDEWIDCEGIVDTEDNVITWSVPKTFMGNPPQGSTITSIFPSTHLRFTEDSGLPLMDLFKDLSWNAIHTHDYRIRY